MMDTDKLFSFIFGAITAFIEKLDTQQNVCFRT